MKTIISHLPILYSAFAFITACCISLVVVPFVIRFAKSKSLLDQPDQRKEHTHAIPTLGGFGIFAGFIISFLIWNDYTNLIQIGCVLISLTILFITGIVDDLKDLKATHKLLIQIIAATIITFSGIKIESLNGLLGVYELPVSIQYILSVFLIAGVTNAVNLIDGINGLAGGIILANCLVFVTLFSLSNNTVFSVFAASLGGGILGFLRYNFNKAKIFMGDTGSLVLGFSIAVMSIKFMQVNTIENANSLIIVFGILILPVFDTIRVFSIRILKSKSPFSADKNHIHHLLIKTGYNHLRSALIMYAANAILIVTAFVLSYYSIKTISSLLVLTTLAVFLSEILTIKRSSRIRSRIHYLINETSKRKEENKLLFRSEK